MDILKKILEVIYDLVSTANLSSIIDSFILAGIILFIKYLYNIFPGRAVFYDVKKFKEINFFFKYLQSKDGIFPTATREMEMSVQNTPVVVGIADFKGVTDCLILIRKYLKSHTVNYFHAEHSDRKETTPFICIGSSEKTYKIIENKVCEPIYFKYTPGLSLSNRNDDYHDYESNKTGHGVIQKSKVRNTEVDAFFIMGMGKLGTTASARYFVNNINTIGKMYGRASFCLLIGAENDDDDSGKVIHIYPKPKVWRRIVFARAWWQISKFIK